MDFNVAHVNLLMKEINIKNKYKNNNIMKLLYIVQYFSFPDQPDGTRPYDLASSFVKKGIDVTIITSDTSGAQKEKWAYVEREGLKIHYLNCAYNNNMGFTDRIKAFMKFFTNATKKALSLDYDLMLASSTPLTNGIPALVSKWKKKKPYIFEVRDVWPGVPIAMGYFKNKMAQRMLYAFEKKIYKNASAIVPLSTGMDANIKLRYPNDKSVVIPNISEVNRFANIVKTTDITIPEGKKMVLYAGTLGNVNGIGYVVNLAEKTLLLDPDLLYYIVGTGKEKQDLLQMAEEKGVLNKNLFFFDPVKKDDLPYLYSIATVGSSFVIDIPALWDNSANKFFDTLAAHKPMVINHRGWQADEIEKHNYGYVLPPVVDDKMAADFVTYMNNAELLKRHGENAYKQAVQEYSLELAVDKYMKIINSIVN